jgi:hypothetical protein
MKVSLDAVVDVHDVWEEASEEYDPCAESLTLISSSTEEMLL